MRQRTPHQVTRHAKRHGPRAAIPAAILAASLGGLALAGLALETGGEPESLRETALRSDPAPVLAAAAQPETGAHETAPIDSWVQIAPPAGAKQIMAQTDPQTLVNWSCDPSVRPELRFGALRRLEALDPGQALRVASALASDPAPMVRTNAIATLALSDTPLAQAAVSRLRGRDALLARTIAANRRLK